MEIKAHNSFARFEKNPLAAICLVYCVSYKNRLIERLALIVYINKINKMRNFGKNEKVLYFRNMKAIRKTACAAMNIC